MHRSVCACVPSDDEPSSAASAEESNDNNDGGDGGDGGDSSLDKGDAALLGPDMGRETLDEEQRAQSDTAKACGVIFASFFATKPGGFARKKGERCNGRVHIRGWHLGLALTTLLLCVKARCS